MTGALRETDLQPLSELLLDEARIHGPGGLLGRSGLMARMMKELAECLLAAELQQHLLRPALQETVKLGNYRNGSTPKTVSTNVGKIELAVPRVRFSTFVPQLVPRYQRQIPGFDHTIVVLYARGLPDEMVRARLLGLYGADAWEELGDALTGALLRHTVRWRARRLDPDCALLYCDALPAPTPLLFALAMSAEGERDVLGMWSGHAGQPGLWGAALGELRQRGLLIPDMIAGDAAVVRQAAAQVYPGARFWPIR